jgi:hypothetical protein
MKIEVKRSGGFAGITTTFLVDEKLVTSAEASQLEELVNRAGFFDLSSKSPGRHGADYYTYDITIEMSGKRHTVKATDITISDSLRSIVNRVMQIHNRPSNK